MKQRIIGALMCLSAIGSIMLFFLIASKCTHQVTPLTTNRSAAIDSNTLSIGDYTIIGQTSGSKEDSSIQYRFGTVYLVTDQGDTILKTEYNSALYPYLTKERNAVFEIWEQDKSHVEVGWFVWYDDEVIDCGVSSFPPSDLEKYEQHVRIYASEKIRRYQLSIKNKY